MVRNTKIMKKVHQQEKLHQQNHCHEENPVNKMYLKDEYDSVYS